MEGLVLCPPSSTPFLASAARSDGNFFPQKLPSCLFVFFLFSVSGSAVRSGSGGLAGAQHDRKARLVDRRTRRVCVGPDR